MSGHLFVRLRPSSSRPRTVPDDARRSSQGRPFWAAAQRLGLELSEHVIMLGPSGMTDAMGRRRGLWHPSLLYGQPTDGAPHETERLEPIPRRFRPGYHEGSRGG